MIFSFARNDPKSFVRRFEKMISGMFMVEFVRVVLERPAKEGL